MKKLFIYSMLALSGFMLPACGDDDPEPKQAEPTVEGQWNFAKVVTTTKDANGNQVGNPKEEKPNGSYMVNFETNNNYSEDYNSRISTGTFTHTNNQVTVTNQPATSLSGVNNLDSLTTSRMILTKSVSSNGLTTSIKLTLVK